MLRFPPGRPCDVLCSLCDRASAETGHRLSFTATERTEHRPHAHVRLDLHLCQRCSNRAFKHLKRMIAKRRFTIREA